MTKKNFIKAASIVREFREKHSQGGFFKQIDAVNHVADQIENSFVEFFSDDNPRFDAHKFRQACK